MLWGTRDFTSGNNKPNWANTANVYGVDTTEAGLIDGVTPGWVEVKRGLGYVIGVDISNAGSNITSAGFVTITGGSPRTAANISFGINSVSKTVNTVTLVSGGDGYLTMPTANVANTGVGFPAVFTLRMGGRFNRNTYETLVVVKGMTGDSEDTEFPDS